MLTPRGHAKLLDFGLAKALEALRRDDDTHSPAMNTREGTMIGTVAYMSPEQSAERTVDARSDVFSFGAVLYEMATGRRAFTGNTPAETLSAILTAQPEPIDRVRPSLLPELRRIVEKCLEKDCTVAVPDAPRRRDGPGEPAARPHRGHEPCDGRGGRSRVSWRSWARWWRRAPGTGMPAAARPAAVCDCWRSCRSSRWPAT